MGPTDEAEYFDTRDQQLARKLQREHGLSGQSSAPGDGLVSRSFEIAPR